MRIFSLLFDRDGEEHRIEFEARDPSAALGLAESQGHDRAMRLFEGETHLGTIEEMGGFWRLTPATAQAA